MKHPYFKSLANKNRKTPFTLKEMKKDFFDKKIYMNLSCLINQQTHLYVILSYKGTGKSQSLINYFIWDMLENGSEFAWIRNKEKEFLSSKVVQSFNRALNEFGVGSSYYVSQDGLFRTQDDKQFGMFAFLNTSDNTTSQNTITAKNIAYDEIINPTFTLASMFTTFQKMISTLTRKQKHYIWLLGNKHESRNDILSELAIEFDWENPDHQEIHRPEQGVSAYYLGRYEIDANKDAEEQIDKIGMYSEEWNKFSSGGVQNNNMFNIKSWRVYKLWEVFKPLWKYDLNGSRYAVGIIEGEDEPTMYIRILSNNDYDVKTYCYRAIDKKSDNIYVKDVNSLDTVEKLLDFYASGRLYFSTHFASSEFELLLNFLNILKKFD